MQSCGLSPPGSEVAHLCKAAPELLPRPALASPTLETDSNDSVLGAAKLQEEAVFSPQLLLSDQLQKHLLSSTLQTGGGGGGGRASSRCSPPSISTTPALSFVPTPSPSPFTNMADMNFTLAADPKSVAAAPPQYSPGPASAPGTKLASTESLGPCSLAGQLSYSAEAAAPAISGQQLVLVESAVSTSIPSSLALLAAPQPISLLQPPASPRFNTASSSSSLNHMSCSSTALPTSLIHPNKKKRLLTFLTEQENSICSVNTDSSQIILTPAAAQKPEQLLFTPAKTVPDQILLNSAKADTLSSSQPPTLFLQPCVNTLSTLPAPAPLEPVKQEAAATLIINPPPPKPESTLIFNSEGTAAALITASPAPLPLLQVPLSSAPPPLALVQPGPAPNIDILPVNFPPKPVAASEPPGHNLEALQDQDHSNFAELTESVTCYKCKLCGFLVTNQAALKHHFLDDHEDMVREDEVTLATAWLAAALRLGLQLQCPLCPNTFKSGRSFQVKC